MSRSNNRNLSDIANPNNNLISVSNNDVTITGAGVTQYDSADLLPTSGVTTGTQAYVAATGKLYIRGDGGWYNIATVNQSPTMTSVLDSGGGSGPFTLATDGSVTRITTTATDPEGFPITFTATPDADFNNLASVSIDSTGGRIFTITPFSEDSATTTSGTITFKASDGVNIASSVQTFSLSFVSIISNSKKSSLLMKATGNNGTNSTVTDASSGSHTLTMAGDTFTTSFSPYRAGGYNTHLTTASSYIRTATSSDFDIGGTGNFSLEGFIFVNSNHSLASYARFFSFDTYYSGSKSFGVLINDAANSNHLSVYAVGSRILISSINFPKDQWNHIVLCRTGNDLGLFLNGLRIAHDGSFTTSLNSGNTYLQIGQTNDTGATDGFIGEVRDVRFINGSHVYDASSGFLTVPTESLTAVTNTKFLINNVGYLKDLSASGHALSFSGTITKTVSKITAFSNTTSAKSGLAPYDFQTFNASKHGGSIKVDGNSDYVSATHSSDFNFGSGDFTVECWFYAIDSDLSSAGSQCILTTADSTDFQGIYFGIQNNNTYFLISDGSGSSWDGVYAGSATVYPNQWYHLAAVRNGNTFKVYLNGVEDSSNTSSITLTNTNNIFRIGGRTVSSQYFNGFVSNVRVVKGSAVYTSAFTPPTSPLTAVTNTKLLMNPGTGVSIFDALGGHSFDLSSGITSSTTKKKNAAASLYADGTAPQYGGASFEANSDEADNVDFEDEPFTIECWFWNLAAPSGEKTWFQLKPGGSTFSNNITAQFRDNIDPGGLFIYFTGGNAAAALTGHDTATMGSSFSSDLVSTDWTHMAITRNPIFNTTTLYLNGVATDTSTSTSAVNSNSSLLLGGGHSSGWQGYIEDFRISTGSIRYPIDPVPTTLSSNSDTFFLIFHTSNVNTIAGDSNWTVGNGGVGPVASDFGPAPGMKSAYFNDNDNSKLTLTSAAASSVYTMGNPSNGAADNFSIEFWMWPDEDAIADNATTTFSTYGEAAGGSVLRFLQRTDGKHRINRLSNSGNHDITSTNTAKLFIPRTWTHYYYAEEYSGSSMYWAAFANGVLMDSGSRANSVTSSFDMQNITIGCRGDNQNPFKGYISNMRLQRGTVAFPKAAYNQFNVPTSQLLG